MQIRRKKFPFLIRLQNKDKMKENGIDDVQTHQTWFLNNLSSSFILKGFSMTLNKFCFLIWKYAAHTRVMNVYDVISLQKEDTWD